MMKKLIITAALLAVPLTAAGSAVFQTVSR